LTLFENGTIDQIKVLGKDGKEIWDVQFVAKK
jgi:hypothetical protein